jgi:hypothetical protein
MDAFRPNNSNKSIPVRPDQRSHWYELDLIATLRGLQDTGVVRETTTIDDCVSLKTCCLVFVWPWRRREHRPIAAPVTRAQANTGPEARNTGEHPSHGTYKEGYPQTKAWYRPAPAGVVRLFSVFLVLENLSYGKCLFAGRRSNGRRGFVGPASRELSGTETATLPHDDDDLQETKQHDEFPDAGHTAHHLHHERKKPPRSKGHGLMELLPRLGLRGTHKADGKEKPPIVPIQIDTPRNRAPIVDHVIR